MESGKVTVQIAAFKHLALGFVSFYTKETGDYLSKDHLQVSEYVSVEFDVQDEAAPAMRARELALLEADRVKAAEKLTQIDGRMAILRGDAS